MMERKLIEIRVGMEPKDGWWLHKVAKVWEYPDGSKRIVDSGCIGFGDAQREAEQYIESFTLPEPVDGPMSGKRIRAKGPGELFVCDGEYWIEGERWAVCDLGIPEGTMGTILDYDAGRNDYYVEWDDGEKWGNDPSGRPACKWSRARGGWSLERILESAEIVEEGK